ncbi:HesB-like protein [Sedimentibacter sp.]|uniref:HesB-like protein n=1 Tax=Sedimentibacter sp. TaxID=1960295 RepID=UPI00289EB056|nr:HesB-like protein [Sedimentibacter sp.]
MIFINETAYKEFKELLDEANVESYNIRIDLDRYGCNGPIFGVYPGEATEDDDVDTINEINFIVNKAVNKEFGGFIIVSNEENDGQGVGLKPIVQPASTGDNGGCGSGGGCGGCTGCQQ